MTRFALTVAAIEVVLTVVASFLIAATELPDVFLSETDLAGLRAEVLDHRTWRTGEPPDFPRYHTRATLAKPRRELSVTFRIDESPDAYRGVRERERARLAAAEGGRGGTLIDERFPGQRGFAVRQYSGDAVRFALARRRKNEVLIVEVSQEGVTGVGARRAMSRCEWLARKAQDRLLDKIRWR